MKKLLIATTCLTLLSSAALAQTSAPQGGSAGAPNSNPSAANKMDKGTTSGTSTMSNDSMQKDSMKKDTPMKGGESKDGDGMNKGGMSK